MRVEMAFGSGFSTPETARSWTEITPKVRGEKGITVSRGRGDQQSQPTPSTLGAVLNNDDGRFTPELSSSPYFPNVVQGVPIRYSVRYSDAGSGNFLSANQASFETSVSDWTPGGSVPPTRASSTTHVDAGTKAMLITWGTGGTLPLVQTTIDDRAVVGGLVIGRTYTVQARVWVPTGSPNPELVIPGIVVGAATSTKNAFATISVTFTATARTHLLQVWPASAPTSGQQCWVDSVMVDEGSVVGTFTTTPAYGIDTSPGQYRYTGYVDEFPIEWPDGHELTSTIAITGSSRSARLGRSAKLGSAIRTAYLATAPIGYWPMDEDTDFFARILTGGTTQAFRDITNTNELFGQLRELLGSFGWNPAYAPVVRDGTAGPEDEQSLVRFPSYSDSSWIGTDVHDVSSANTEQLTGDLTFEAVARVELDSDAAALVCILSLRSADQLQHLDFNVGTAIVSVGGNLIATNGLIPEIILRDLSFALVEDIDDNIAMPAAVDGEIHHYLLTLTGNTTAKFYFDGVLVSTLSLASHTFGPFTNVCLGIESFQGTSWIGHAAVHDRALTPTEIATRAAAATAATETISERIDRIGGFMSIPAAEIDVEATIAAPLGPQTELDQAPADVLNKVASSTAGVLFDGKDGHLVMQARNHRYNPTPLFTVGTATEEIAGDFKPTRDLRYLCNSVKVTRAGSTTSIELKDDASIDANGEAHEDFEITTSDDRELEAFAADVLRRRSTPLTRVDQVTIDISDLTTAQRALVLSAEIGDMFIVGGLPASAPRSSMNLFIEGYTENTDTLTGQRVTFNTTAADDFAGWVLDDAVLSILDSTTFAVF